jgi:elongation factor Ts
MTTISAKTVSELRERTGAALMDCKRALEATAGDLEAAIDHLRKSGLKSAEKRAGRSTAEGRVQAQYAADGKSGAMVALTSETDFVARSDDFKALLSKLVKLAFDKRLNSPEALLEQKLDGTSVQEAIKLLSGKLGENVQIPKVAYFENKAGTVGGYIHHNDKIAALVSVTTDAPADKSAELVKNLGMHVTFARPIALVREQVPADAIEREKAVHADSDEVKSKPADKRDMIVKGKLEKYFATVALVEQPWFKDDKLSVKKVVESTLGPKSKVEGFALFSIGG